MTAICVNSASVQTRLKKKGRRRGTVPTHLWCSVLHTRDDFRPPPPPPNSRDLQPIRVDSQGWVANRGESHLAGEGCGGGGVDREGGDRWHKDRKKGVSEGS